MVLSQTQLAQRLRDDGFPVTQSDISKMESAVELLLPHIPDVLYGGLSRPGVEKILLLCSNAEHYWYQDEPGKPGRLSGLILMKILSRKSMRSSLFSVLPRMAAKVFAHHPENNQQGYRP